MNWDPYDLDETVSLEVVEVVVEAAFVEDVASVGPSYVVDDTAHLEGVDGAWPVETYYSCRPRTCPGKGPVVDRHRGREGRHVRDVDYLAPVPYRDIELSYKPGSYAAYYIHLDPANQVLLVPPVTDP